MNESLGASGSTPFNALVLGGGGPVGASWTAALLYGLASAGLPLAEADVVVGTSAGAVAGAWLTMRPEGLAMLAEHMRKRASGHADKARSGEGTRSLIPRLIAKSEPDIESARSIGRDAIAAIAPVSAEEAQGVWEEALPQGPWPGRLRVVSVDAHTGLARAWSAGDGITLPVAVSTSTAAPGVAPPVATAGSVWVDGGVRSATNADLVVGIGYDRGREPIPGRVIVVAPLRTDQLTREQTVLADSGYDVRLITGERFYETPTELFDPRFIDVAVAAGVRQADALAAGLLTWWNQ